MTTLQSARQRGSAVLKLQLWFALCFCVLLQGCVFPYPHYNWLTPELDGIVFDQHSQKPIKGALIQYIDKKEISTYSNANGKYNLAPLRRYEFAVHVCPGLCKAIPRTYDIQISYKGRTSVTQVSNCSGHPSSQCNKRKLKMNLELE